jgi:RimJ/RimL family protein N-acetyltransferase
VSARWCGIGIETVATYRGRGLARATAQALLGECASRGLVPHWDAWADNLPSVAVAKRIGFELVEEYAVLVTRLS